MELRLPPLLDQEREADLVARLARAVVAEKEDDGAAELGRLLGGHEDVERRRDPVAAGAVLAADEHVEAGDGLAAERFRRWHKGDVLRLGVRAVLAAARDRHVELPGEVRVRHVAHERVGEGPRDGRAVEQLVGREPGDGAADDVADVVHPRLERHEPDLAELIEDLRHVVDPDPAELDLLSRGDVGDPAPDAVGDAADRAELRSAADPVRDADAHHEMTGRVLAEEDPPPLQPLEVAFLDRVDPKLRVAGNVSTDLEAALLRFDLLDLIHERSPCPPATREHKKRRPSPLRRKAPLPLSESDTGLSEHANLTTQAACQIPGKVRPSKTPQNQRLRSAPPVCCLD